MGYRGLDGDGGTMVYCCADASLTWGPYGGSDKIIEAALPVLIVKDEKEAREVVTLVAQHPRQPDDYDGTPIHPGYGPSHRVHYSLRNFRRGDVETLAAVSDTLAEIRDACREGDRERLTRAFRDSEQGLGLHVRAAYEGEEHAGTPDGSTRGEAMRGER